MNELLNGASSYEYEDRGMNPLQAAQTEDETMPYTVSDSGGGVKFGSIVEEQMKIAEGNSLLYLYIYICISN